MQTALFAEKIFKRKIFMYKSINLKDINTAEAQNFLQHAIAPRRKILSGNRLGQLANVYEMPVIDPSFEDEKLKKYFSIFLH